MGRFSWQNLQPWGPKGYGSLLFKRGTEALVPPDMQGLRGQSIDLLSQFLRPGAFDVGGAGTNFFFNSPLQRQGIGVEQFLSQPSPEMRAFDVSRPILEEMLTGTGPQFERDLGMANATGGRFGSANAILRGEALRNLYNQRTQTAQTLGMLSGQAGQSQFDRLMQYQNMRLQLLAGLFGMGAQSTLGLPVQQGQSMFDRLMAVAKLGASLYSAGSGGAGGGGGTTA